MNAQPRNLPGGSPRGCLAKTVGTIVSGMVALIVCTVAALSANSLEQVIAAPWSVSLGGRAMMSGRWHGSFVSPDGVRGALYLALDVARDSHGYFVNEPGQPNVEGTAQICTRQTNEQYEAWGRADRSGAIQALHLRAKKEPALSLFDEVSSRWDGDTLTLTGVYRFDLSGRHVISGALGYRAPTTTVVLQRSGESDYRAACQTLAAASR